MKQKIIESIRAVPIAGKTYEEYVEALAERLEEAGAILPPCKVGDTVYWLDDENIKQGEIFEISIHSDGILVHTGTRFCLERVFLTREEAEKALERREE